MLRLQNAASDIQDQAEQQDGVDCDRSHPGGGAKGRDKRRGLDAPCA
jgi:hypothetical protein